MIDRSYRRSDPRGETSEDPRLNEEVLNHLDKLRKLHEGRQAHDLLSE